MTFTPAMCLGCQRLRFNEGESKCAAFPAGIPPEILVAGADHRFPFAGDHGVRFMQKDTDEARQAFANWQLVFGSARPVA